MIVADNETSIDLLYCEAIARTVVRLVSENSDEPLSAGVHGDWGAGKSSVLMMVEEAFDKDERVLCVRFNGWLFQGFEDAKAFLIESIVDELLRKRSASDKVVEQARKVLRRVDWMKVARKAGPHGLSLATGMPLPETVKDPGAVARAIMTKGGEGATAENLATLVDGPRKNQFAYQGSMACVASHPGLQSGARCVAGFRFSRRGETTDPMPSPAALALPSARR